MNQERIQQLKSFIKEEPNDPFNHYALAMEYYNELPDKAMEVLEQLTRQHPDYLPTYFKLAHLFWEAEEWDEADETFQAGIALAEKQSDSKALTELKSAYQNFEFERED